MATAVLATEAAGMASLEAAPTLRARSWADIVTGHVASEPAAPEPAPVETRATAPAEPEPLPVEPAAELPASEPMATKLQQLAPPQEPLRPGAKGSQVGCCECRGRVLTMMGPYGWIEALDEVEIQHPEAWRNSGHVYVHRRDVQEPTHGWLRQGDVVHFTLYADERGLGAEAVRREEQSAPGFSSWAPEFVPSATTYEAPTKWAPPRQQQSWQWHGTCPTGSLRAEAPEFVPGGCAPVAMPALSAAKGDRWGEEWGAYMPEFAACCTTEVRGFRDDSSDEDEDSTDEGGASADVSVAGGWDGDSDAGSSCGDGTAGSGAATPHSPGTSAQWDDALDAVVLSAPMPMLTDSESEGEASTQKAPLLRPPPGLALRGQRDGSCSPPPGLARCG